MKTSIHHLLLLTLGAIAASCSTTSSIPEGEQLFTGLKAIRYVDVEPSPHATSTQTEMESVLASTPNGALFGSSYYRTPFPVRLWIWNAFANHQGGVARWLTKAFGSRPKLMSQVNPELRASVAEAQLKKFGYFHGKVDYQIVQGRNPKKAKLAYTVTMGPLWTLDSIRYLNFPATMDSLIAAHADEAAIHNGDAFDVPVLESERKRLATLLRNNGYYYYEKNDASYLADTLRSPQKAQIHLLLADSLAPRVTRQWHIGKVNVNFRKQFMQTLTDSIVHPYLTFHFSGRRPPIRPGVVLRGQMIRPRQLYSYENEQLSLKNLQATGLFSYYNLQFTPRDTTGTSDTLDVNLDLVFDKPYDFYVEANANGKTTGHMGPELVLGLTKRNAFHSGEKLDMNVHGSYEWLTGHHNEGTSSGMNSYEYGADVALSVPRLVTPRSLFASFARNDRRRPMRRPRYALATSYTQIKASFDVLNRARYFKRHVAAGELTYDWWSSANAHHSFSPLSLSYEYMQHTTHRFDSLLEENPYLQISMRDQFVPKMSYTYTYTSPASLLHPISWTTTISEAGNVLSVGYAAFGQRWSEKGKKMFKNPFAQFLKIETDFVKAWQTTTHSSLVAHLGAGVVWSYGNASQAPYYEQFYIGGANSVRAFNVRSIGPGKYMPGEGRFSYVDQTGDVKFLANLEYRPRLWGSLYGALFLDAGNVWTLHNDESRAGSKFEGGKFLKQMALGTGIGVRYDMGMFVIRLDWGVGLHVPYDTSRSGFYNVESFKDAQSIHLAIGYPF